jgi:hypothetical protein
MNNYLSNIPTIVHKVNDEYHIIYNIDNYIGGCNYKHMKPKSKYQVEPIYILTQVDMSDIISYINDKAPLNDGDLINLQMEIRTHSLNTLKEYLMLHVEH